MMRDDESDPAGVSINCSKREAGSIQSLISLQIAMKIGGVFRKN